MASSTVFSWASSCVLFSLRAARSLLISAGDSLSRLTIFLTDRISWMHWPSVAVEFFYASRAAILDWALKNLRPLPSKNATGWIISFREEGRLSLIWLKISLIGPTSWIKIKVSSSRWSINLCSWALMKSGIARGVSSKIKIGSSSRYSSRPKDKSGKKKPVPVMNKHISTY